MKKILIPTDFSDLTNYAYDLANKISHKSDFEIHSISIVAAPGDLFFDPAGNLKEDDGKDLTDLFKKEEEAIQKMSDWLKDKPNIKANKVKIGRVNEDILRYVEENNIDLIVMGTKGAFGVEEVVKGSHAGNIALRSPIPVLTLKCDRSKMVIKDLLFVNDFKKQEKLDMGIIKALQQAFNTKLHLLKVNTQKDFEPNSQIEFHMQQFADLNELEHYKFHVYCDENIEEGIINFSTDTGIDFVVIGTTQRSRISRLFKESVSNKMLNHLWQPVLTFPI